MHNMPHSEEAKRKMSLARTGKPQFQNRRPTKILDGITYYRCGRCGNFFPKEGFYKNKRTILGITSECKNCHTQTSILSRDKESARDSNKRYMRNARTKNPEKFRARERKRQTIKDQRYFARMKLSCAVRRGEIDKPETCQECGAKVRITGHHKDYGKPLEVRWLCYECHGKRHRKDTVIEFERAEKP